MNSTKHSPGSWISGVVLLGVALLPLRAADVVQFTVRVVDDAGQPMPARVLVRDERGQSYLPPAAMSVNVGSDAWFACDGGARLDVPAGRYQLEVERGPEFERASGSVALTANTTREVRLHRWVDLRARGYRTGEDHLHVPPAMLPALMAAEDLDFGTSLQWWNGPKWAVAPTVPSASSSWFDAEVENSWGAVYCIGLSRPMPLSWNPARPNLAFAKLAREDGALVCYQGGWSAEALVDALLGYVDVVNVADNLFQRHKFMPRARYSNLLGVPGFPTYPETAEGMLQLSTESYYRLLNCGLHVAAGAGSATGVKSSPAGYNRSYVHVGPRAGVREFLDAWRRGRNFVTNGPMLLVTANGAEPGETVDLPPGGGRVSVHVEALSSIPLRRVSVVVNGQTVATTPDGTLDTSIDVKQGSWICALALADEEVGAQELSRYRQSSRLGGEEPTGLRFAHSSPVYVTVGGKGARVERSVAEARQMLDAFETFAHRNAAPEYQAETIEAVARARAKLELPVTPVAVAVNSAVIPAAKDGSWLKRHEGFVAEAQRGGIDVLFLGDSITDFWRDVNARRGGREVWDREFAPLHAANFGIAGDRTQNVLWRIQHGEVDGLHPKVVVLMIGTNNTGFEPDKVTPRNTATEAAEGVRAVVRELRGRLPDSKILLLAVFPKGDRPGGRGRLDVAAVNRGIASLNDPPMIRFLDIGPSFLGPDGTLHPAVMADFGHPTMKGYEIWAAAMKPLLHEMLND